MNGEIKRAIQLIDRQKFLDAAPKIVENNMVRATSPKREFEISDWAIFENKLYIKNLRRTGENFLDRIDFIDVYSLDESKYLYSFEIPYIFHSFSINDDAMYFIELPDQKVKATSFNFMN